MGNCCSAAKAKGPLDDDKRPINQQASNRSSETLSQMTRASTPAITVHRASAVSDASASNPNGTRSNNLNQLEQMPPRDPPSQVNSMGSSTQGGVLADGRESLGSANPRSSKLTPPSEAKQGDSAKITGPLQPSVGDVPSGHHPRKSLISIVSEFKQDSLDLDEQVPNVRDAHSQKKNLAKGGRLKEGSTRKRGLTGRQTNLEAPSMDLALPQVPRKQIYKITTEFPVAKPYSRLDEWQRVLERYAEAQRSIFEDKPVDPCFDELASNLLNLNNRNWILDQIALHSESRMAMHDSLGNFAKQKKLLQLREHFSWLVWAVGQYYFAAPERVSNQDDFVPGEQPTEINFQSRMTLADQEVSSFEDQSATLVNQSIASSFSQARDQGRERPAGTQRVFQHTHSRQQSQTGAQLRSSTFQCKLPKTNSQQWSEGFGFKGVFFRLLPEEDAAHILEEVKALKYAHAELLDLQAHEQAMQSQQAEYSEMNTIKNSGNAPSDSKLNRDLILPLLVVVKCYGFVLYGTPLIYTQEMRSSDNLGGSFKGPHLDAPREPFISNLNSIVNVDFSDASSDGITLPRFSSVNQIAAGGLSQINQRKGSFAYLHENIEEETLKDPLLQRMPLLKGLSRKNLIPVIDFEEFNKAQSGSGNMYASGLSSGRPVTLTINYLLVYLASSLRSLSVESSSAALFQVPTMNNEDIVFHQYPQEHKISISLLDSLMSASGPAAHPGSVSQKPAGDSSPHAKGLRLPEEEKRPMTNSQANFRRRFLSKHGWNCYLIEKRSSGEGHIMRGGENKRASILFSQRENSAGGLEAYLDSQDALPSIKETQEAPNFAASRESNPLMSSPQSNPFRVARNFGGASAHENPDSTPKLKQAIPQHPGTATQASQQVFVSPKKKTILKKSEGARDELISGNVVVSATYSRGFKILFSLTQHSYASGIETMFQLAIDRVAQILDSSDRVPNIATLKELMHRKGLNMRFCWALLTKVKLRRSRDLIQAAILVRVMRRIVNEEVKIKSNLQYKQIISQSAARPVSQSNLIQSTVLKNGRGVGSNLMQAASRDAPAFRQANASHPLGLAQQSTTGQLQGHLSDGEHYQGNRRDLYRECISLFANAVMKNKYAKHKQVFDEALLGLFLSRMKMLQLAHSLELSETQLNFLESKDSLDHVLEMPSTNPILFLNSVQEYFQVDFSKEFQRHYRQDKFHILNKPQPIGKRDILAVKPRVVTYFSLREQAYFILARKISHNKRLRESRQILRQQSNLRDSKNITKIFSRPQRYLDNSTVMDQSQTDRLNDDHTQRAAIKSTGQHPLKQSTLSSGKPSIAAETQRNFHNFNPQHSAMPNRSLGNGSIVSASSGNGGYQNIIDLSRNRSQPVRPRSVGEILMPSCLYKMHTSVEEAVDATQGTATSPLSLSFTGGTSVFQPYYEMPNIDVVNEWVIVLESLLSDVYSVQGCEHVLMEALIYQCVLTLLLEQDPHSSEKIVQKATSLLLGAHVCPPELIVMCMTLSGVMSDLAEELDQFPIESERHYLTAMVLALQIYGDPRGRGNASVPFMLFLSWKLSLLALADGKKLVDCELSEEIFDATLASLYNHKRSYKNAQLELFAAQEQAHKEQISAALGGASAMSASTLVAPQPPSYSSQLNNSTFIKQSQQLQFEITLEQAELAANHFDMKKYRRRPRNVVMAGGFVKQSTQMVPAALSQNFSQGQAKIATASRNGGLQRVGADQPKQPSMNHLQKSNYDAEISDIDIEFKMEDDEFKSKLVELNFREAESSVGKVPLPHWTINRQMYGAKVSALSKERPNEARLMKKEMIRDQLTKYLDIDFLFPWVITYCPTMAMSGLTWDAKTIKQAVFVQNAQIMGSSEPSSITFSSHKMSQYSYRSGNDHSAKRRRAFLNPYSQYLGPEVSGLHKGEVLGCLYSWGTDQYGQLGLDTFVTGRQQGALHSLKLFHPRLVVPLKDQLIKEVCCGYAHTLAINQYGQLFTWGQNECGQLGLGADNVPDVVRRPVFNPHISNIVKLAAGHEHSLALTKSSELYVWGAGSLTGLDREEPVSVPTVLDFFGVAIAKAPFNRSAQSNKIVQIACGGLHTAVLTDEGDLFTWGSSEGGQLGIKVDVEDPQIKIPTRIEYLYDHDVRVAQVSCGEAHTVVLTKQHKVWGWGMSMYGQLGLGFSGDSFEPGEGMLKSRVEEPTEITEYLPPEIRITKIICGAAFTMFLTKDEELYGCGINDLGQLGLDTYLEEMQIAVLDRARQRAGGKMDVVTSDVTVPSRVICFEGLQVKSITCGESHSLALIGEEKGLWAWGMYRNGQLGLGEVNQKMNPRPVQSLHSTKIHKLAAGSQHSMALLGDSNQLTAMAGNFYLNSDILVNPWGIDYRRLSQKDDRKPDESLAQRPNP